MIEPDDMAVGIVAGLLEERTGQQLTNDRRWRIGTALSGLFRERGICTSSQMVAMLTDPDNPGFASKVVEALLNNETYFFRDRAMFDQLQQKVMTQLAESRSATKHLRIWSAGCSTGQECFSLAMIFAENRARWAGWSIEIVGTDVSRNAIDQANHGNYSHFEIQRGLGVSQMLNFFKETSTGWHVIDQLRDVVRFEVHNILDAAPAPGRFDLILCRNVLLYFNVNTRRRAFDRVANALAPGGRLMLGAGETVIGQTERFEPIAGMTGIYGASHLIPENAQNKIAS